MSAPADDPRAVYDLVRNIDRFHPAARAALSRADVVLTMTSTAPFPNGEALGTAQIASAQDMGPLDQHAFAGMLRRIADTIDREST